MLPQKDAQLAKKFLDNRNFQGILELVESDIYKARKNSTEEESNEYEGMLIELKSEVLSYMSYLDVPYDTDDYDYF